MAKHLGAYRRFLPGGLHTRRMTLVIDTDRRIRYVVANERSMTAHADAALEVLRREQAT